MCTCVSLISRISCSETLSQLLRLFRSDRIQEVKRAVTRTLPLAQRMLTMLRSQQWCRRQTSRGRRCVAWKGMPAQPLPLFHVWEPGSHLFSNTSKKSMREYASEQHTQHLQHNLKTKTSAYVHVREGSMRVCTVHD